MTSLETTIEAPQITNFADIPIEFWIAMGIQILFMVFAIWVFVKLVKFTLKILTRNMKPRLPIAAKTILSPDVSDGSEGDAR